MTRRGAIAAIGIALLMIFSDFARADDEIGIQRFVISGTRTGILRAVADGSIYNQLDQAGLDEQLESLWPSNVGGSPKDVFVNVYVKVNFFLTVYTVKIQLTRADGQTWEAAVQAAGGQVLERSLNGASGTDEGVNADLPTVIELLISAFPNEFPPGAVIVINPDGGNGNYCGPGTPYDCVYATGPNGLPISTSINFGGGN